MAEPVNSYKFLTTSRVLPSVQGDNSWNGARGGRYGEEYAQLVAGSRMWPLADEGSYFLATNPTPGTGIAGHPAPTTIDDTKPFLLLRNGAAPAAGAKRVYLDYIKLQTTVAGAGATNTLFGAKLDKGANRYSSGGSTLTPVNPNMDSSAAPAMTVKCGAVVAAAASADVRLLTGGQLARSVVTVVGDTYLWVFGQSEKALSSMIVAGTAIANIVFAMPPVVIGPEQMFLLHQGAASQSGAHSFEVEVGWTER
jgi:hypothetical protein